MKHLIKELKKGKKIISFLHEVNHNALPASLLEALIDALYPYIAFICTALIIDNLLSEKWQSALTTAIFMIVLQTVAGILLELIKAYNETTSMTINRQCTQKLCESSLSVDYQTLEDKDAREELAGAEFSMQRNGGFGMLLINYRMIFKDILSIIISIIFVCMLCVSVSEQRFELLDQLLSPVGSLVFLFSIIFIIFFIYQKFARYSNAKIFSMFDEEMRVEQEFSYFSNEVFLDYTKAKEVRLYNMKDMLLKLYNSRMQTMANCFYRKLNFQTHLTYGASFINDGLNIIVYLFIILKILTNAITIGEFTKYVGSFQQMNKAINELIEKTNQIRISNSYLLYILEYSSKKNQLDTGTLPIEKRNDHVYEIEFHHVSFKYPKTSEYVLNNLSMKLTLKDKLAVVGRNGAGKTTFIKLLCRLYDPSEGYITLNGIDIRKYDYIEYLQLFSVVFQDFSMFAFPLKENIAASQDVDEEKIWSCLDKAGVKDKILKLKNQLDTPLMKYEEDGVEISGGEAQKLAIARALYKDAPFVVLDEPTAALDPISEYEIYSRFNDLVNDKTSIFISHRMSSCRFCDDILVFDKGSMIQRGSHADLIADIDNVYARMWNAQAKYYA